MRFLSLMVFLKQSIYETNKNSAVTTLVCVSWNVSWEKPCREG